MDKMNNKMYIDGISTVHSRQKWIIANDRIRASVV